MLVRGPGDRWVVHNVSDPPLKAAKGSPFTHWNTDHGVPEKVVISPIRWGAGEALSLGTSWTPETIDVVFRVSQE